MTHSKLSRRPRWPLVLAVTLLAALAGSSVPRPAAAQVGALELDPPSLTITSPAPGARVSSPVTIRADISDASNVEWQVILDDVLLKTGSTKGTRAIDFSAPVGMGSHTLLIIVEDEPGNSTESGLTFNVGSLDVAAPVITITAPKVGAKVASPVEIRADITDASDVTWEVRMDGAIIATGATKGKNAVNMARALGLGAHTLSIKAEDAAGNSRTLELTFTVLPPAPGKIGVAPLKLKFNSTAARPARPLFVAIKNSGKGTLTGTVGQPTGTGGTANGVFTVETGGGAFTLAPRKSIRVPVSFNPSNPGNYTGELRISSDDPTKPEVVVQLTGSRK